MIAHDRLRAVLIDLDGTLIDRDAAVRAWLRARGHEREAASFSGGRSLVSLATAVLRGRPEQSTSVEQLAASIRAELPELIPRDGAVLEALERLARAKLRLALVSNGGGRTQRAKLAAAGIDAGQFGCVLISGELRGELGGELAKPDARIFSRALTELGVRREHAIMIGDSPEHDIAGAAAAGLASCWIARGRDYPRALPGPSMIAESFPDALRQLLERGDLR